MMKVCGLAGLLAGALWLAPAPGQAAQGCVRDLGDADAVICPPPDGGLAGDASGRPVCGPGWCLADASGRIRCSSVPGGAVTRDQHGNVLCVGGCVDASAAACRRLVPPPAE